MGRYFVIQELEIPEELTRIQILPGVLAHFEESEPLAAKQDSLVQVSLAASRTGVWWDIYAMVITGPEILDFVNVGMIQCQADASEVLKVAERWVRESNCGKVHGPLLEMPPVDDLDGLLRAVTLVEFPV